MPKPFADWPVLMTQADVQECCGLSERQVGDMFRRPDFPVINPSYRRYRRIHRALLDEWLRTPKGALR